MKSCEGIDFPEAALVEIEKATEGFIVKYTEQDLQTAANRVLENYDMVPGTSLSEVPAADEINDTLVESAFKDLLDVGEDKQLRIKAMDVFTQTLFLNKRLRRPSKAMWMGISFQKRQECFNPDLDKLGMMLLSMLVKSNSFSSSNMVELELLFANLSPKYLFVKHSDVQYRLCYNLKYIYLLCSVRRTLLRVVVQRSGINRFNKK